MEFFQRPVGTGSVTQRSRAVSHPGYEAPVKEKTMNQEIMNLFNPTTPAQVFDQIRISIASPEKILSWSYGEIKKPETINYPPFKPNHNGPFSPPLFLPIND